MTARKKKPAPKRRRVGLREVAEACGVSAMTVSRAINNAYGVHPKTRERILRTAREMGYIQNRLASNLARRNSRTVGVVIPDIAHTIFPTIVQGFEQCFRAENYRLFLCCSYDSPSREYEEAQALLEHCVDGIVLAPSSVAESIETVRLVQSHRCPVVLIDRAVPEAEADFVGYDDFEGARRVVAHLCDAGYRRIAHLTGPEGNWSCRERLRGYCRALEEAGRRFDPNAVLEAPPTIADGQAAMTRLLDREPEIDAVFCWNDPIAIGAYRAIRKRGIRVPQGIGIAGFSGTLEAEILETPLTTVVQDPQVLAQQAASLLLSRMGPHAADSPPAAHIVPTHLAIRRSTQR